MSDPWRETTAFGGKIEYLRNAVPVCQASVGGFKSLESLETPSVKTSERIVSALKTIDLYKQNSFKEKSITGWVEGPAAEQPPCEESVISLWISLMMSHMCAS